MALELHGEVKNGQVMLPLNQAELRRRWLDSLKDGTRVIENLRKEGKAKSWSQVKAHWGLAIEMIRERMIELGWSLCGIAPNKDMIHDILTKACGGVGEMGEVIRLSEMTTTQAAAYFENVRDWAATQLNLVIPDPDPAWRVRMTK